MKAFPSYPRRPHKSGRARITVGRKSIYLKGAFQSKESWDDYLARAARWNAGEDEPVDEAALSTADVVARFLAAQETERTNPDGSRPWNELIQYRHATAPLLALFGDEPAGTFGPRSLKVYQKAAASGSWRAPDSKRRRPGWSRRVVNRHTIRIQTLWAWAESEELLPPGSHAALVTVGGLRKHQHGCRELPERGPAPPADVAAALPFLNPVARDAARLLALTGARPGELCRWTPADIVRGGKVQVSAGSYASLGSCWCAWLRHHKTETEGGAGRFVLLSPAAQTILLPYLDRAADVPLFSPREGEALRRAAQRAARKTPVQPSQLDRRSPSPAKLPGDAYTPDSLTRAIRYACERAKVKPWTAYQLRHSAITHFGSLGDAEAARILAGHSDLGTTRGYLVDDLERAARVLGGDKAA